MPLNASILVLRAGLVGRQTNPILPELFKICTLTEVSVVDLYFEKGTVVGCTAEGLGGLAAEDGLSGLGTGIDAEAFCLDRRRLTGSVVEV